MLEGIWYWKNSVSIRRAKTAQCSLFGVAVLADAEHIFAVDSASNYPVCRTLGRENQDVIIEEASERVRRKELQIASEKISPNARFAGKHADQFKVT
ncbi:hypothetical protein GCM10023156_49830 [Novipirellula rosea]|uniref:Uncharacterized protein n=1 Tax=Novipirellula rosea TaxID=1031540 RepID=A0ABP8NEG9_9BACT